ncbi:MAG: CCA tRNA nucleotidyltransferase [Syntrophales bacterium]|jgi:putative nucleotidyltransferase with HDIG domain|nr:CCA tRNA nucleotidyltransferase [Syntrophales bacterium]MDY0045089.1 CCA tRNA nucleotidyltransferase [Syntrophales bacterium]
MHRVFYEIKKIISPIYEVGGSVRDELLGVEPADCDFATPLLPDEIENRIRNAKRKPFLTGKRFGTIGVKIGGILAEITTFRVEQYRDGKRRPDVRFVDDLMEDLGRRDFTINAIAREEDRLIDPYEGRKDLKRKIIRCVGDPCMRFIEDPLRMLRAVRFASQLGFQIEKATEEAITRSAHLILTVSKERWMAELDKILLARYCEEGLRHFMNTGLCQFIIPELFLQKNLELKTGFETTTMWEHTVETTDSAFEDIHVRWAALLHDIAKPFVRIEREEGELYTNHDLLGYEMVRRLGTYLRWSNKRIQEVSRLVRNQTQDESPFRSAIKSKDRNGRSGMKE